MPNKKSVSRNNIPSVHDDNAYEMYSWQNPNKQALTAQFGGSLCSSAGYYPAGNSMLEPGSHSYGSGVARSQGTLYSDMSWAGPNLGPSPGSSGQMTGGGARRKSKLSRTKKYKIMKKHAKTKKASKASKASNY